MNAPLFPDCLCKSCKSSSLYFYSMINISKWVQSLCKGIHKMFNFNPKKPGGGRILPVGADIACIPSIFIKTSQIVFGKSSLISAFAKKFGEVENDINKPRGRWKRPSIFQMSHLNKKIMLPKANEQRKKKRICQVFHKKKSESFDKNWRNGGRFSKFDQFCATRIFDFSTS